MVALSSERWRRIRLLLVCLLAFSLVAAACGDDDDSSGSGNEGTTGQGSEEGEDEGEEGPAQGGDLVMAHSFSPTGVDPVNSNGASNPNGDGLYFYAIYDMLAYVDNETGEVVPKTLESIETDDGSVWTLKVREGIEFTDGTPYDAEAIKINLERIADPANQSPNTGVAQKIESMEVVDDLTLEVTLKAPDTQFDRNLANQLPFVGSPAAIEAGTIGTTPVGAGPFVFQSWLRDSEMKLTRNPDYWADDQPYLDSLTIRFIEDATQRLNALTTGEVDVMYIHSAYQTAPQIESNANLRLETIDVPGGFTMQFNMSRPPFDDPIARQFMDVAIDRDRLNDTVDFGVLPSGEKLYPESHPLYYEGAELGKYDPEKAQELLDEYVAKHGGPLRFNLVTAESQKRPAEFMQAQLAEYGNVQMEIEFGPGAQTVERALAGDFDSVYFTMNWIDPEPDVSNFLSSNGGRNYTRYSKPEMDEAIAKGRTSRDPKVRQEAYAAVWDLLREDIPFTFWRPLAFHYGVSNDVAEFPTFNAGLIDWAGVALANP